MAQSVLLEVADGVATITLNRPEALNTFNWDILDGLGKAYAQCDTDDDVRAVVVTGAGRAFCAGADLSDGGTTFDSSEREDISSCPLAMQAWDVRKPVIAACNGHAVGVGLGIAMQCDMRIVATDAKYGFLQNRRGVVADFGMSYLLPRLVGMEKAFELLVRAPTLSGIELVERGLAGQAAVADEVLAIAQDIARDMAQNCAPQVMGLHKRLLWQGLSLGQEEAIALESKALNHSMHQSDAIEGGVAYFEKRAPQWQGRVSKDWPEGL
jgi:enoyl-CoA hydratase/carnithine racemase